VAALHLVVMSLPISAFSTKQVGSAAKKLCDTQTSHMSVTAACLPLRSHIASRSPDVDHTSTFELSSVVCFRFRFDFGLLYQRPPAAAFLSVPCR
jgi:hypothetical protein